MAGYDDYQTEEEYIAASKRRVTMADTKELVVRLRAKARHEAGQIEFVSSRQLDRNIFAEPAAALERLERELAENIAARNDFAKDWDAAHNRAEATESELTTLRTRVAKMEEALRAIDAMEEALRAIDAKVVELGLAAQRKANGHKHEKFAAVRHSMRLIVSAALTEEQP